LAQITSAFAQRLGIAARIVPMSDDPVRTRLRTEEGWLDFQDYFVRRRSVPQVREIAYDGAAAARPNRDFLAALADPELRAVVICPSNPFLSIEPILAMPGVRSALALCAAPVVAVAPLIGGEAVKGPTAKIMRELGFEASAAAVARRYADLLDVYVVDRQDVAAEVPGIKLVPAATLMLTLADREALARIVLATADEARR
jgi:LPPG:FO 2-phospho-L-lactate transferase